MIEEPSRIFRFETDDPDHFATEIAMVAPLVTVQKYGRSPFGGKVKMTRLQRLGLFTVGLNSARVLALEPRGYYGITLSLIHI